MTRLGTVFWVALVLTAGFTTFKVKYAVQDIEDELNRVRRQTIAEQQEIRVLTAEWTYLTQPERLTELNRRFLGLASITARQLQRSIEEIPLRAPAAPLDSLDMLVEATLGPDAPQAAATPLPVTPAALSPAPAGPAALSPAPAGPAVAVQLAKAGPAQMASSLDALIAQIAETP
jgi:hypothetical protein